MERKNKKIAIIGHFGGNENFFDGQTIKTKILYEELLLATQWKIIKVDTYYKRHRPVKLLLDTFKCLIKAEDVIVLLSGNGMKIYFPLLFLMSKIFHKKIYHDVIGGNLDVYVKKYHKFRKYLNSFKVNWVETEGMKIKLEELGILNCEVIPNFKNLNIVTVEHTNYTAPYKFCMFSRVMKEKGVELAIDAIQSINENYKTELCRLDIYGRVDEEYKEDFYILMDNVTDAISYKGVVPYDRSVEAIQEYYALLFPTFWQGEGFPGTIVDAFAAGIPVIASDWNCNKEIINDRKTGIIYPSDGIESLMDAIMWFINNSDRMAEIKENCVEEAEKYKPDTHIRKIINTLIEK